MKRVLRFLCFSCLLLVASAVESRKRVLISEIFEVSDARGNLERLRLENVEWVRKALESKDGAAARPEFGRRVLDRAFEKYVEQSKYTFSWIRREEEYVAQYDKFYTEAQLKALLAFLRTDAGQAMSRARTEQVSIMQRKLTTAMHGDPSQPDAANEVGAKSDATRPAATESQFYTEAQRKALIAFIQTDAGQAMQRAEAEILNDMAQNLAATSQKGRDGPDLMNDAIAEVRAEMRVENEKLFTMSLAEVEAKARNGNPVAQYFVGCMYADGQGVEKDPKAAAKWFLLGADQKHPGCQGRLAWLYWRGEGVDKDLNQAVALFTEAAKAEDMMASYFLGLLYKSGEGVEKDTKRAFPLLLKAAQLGHGGAQYEVAILYWNGDGVEKKLSEAYAWVLVAEQSDVKVAKDFHDFMNNRISSDEMADGMMRSVELRRAIKAKH